MSLCEKVTLKFKSELTDMRAAIGNIRTDVRESSAKSESMKCSVTSDGRKFVSRNYSPNVGEYMAISGVGSSESPQTLKSKKRKLPEMRRQQKGANNFYDREVLFVPKFDAAKSVNGSTKAKILDRLDVQSGKGQKGQKMDSNITRQCTTLLKKLMTHKDGWVFNQPVDPVKLNIPDYFKIISRPMDLGTIRRKLESKLYSSTDQFAADVWLTFDNAMQYNPPGNPFHHMAKALNDIFSSKWKELEVNWRNECSTHQSVVKKTQKQVVSSKEILQRSSSLSSSSLPRKSLTSAEKLKLRKQLAELPVEEMPPPLLGFLRRTCLLGQNQSTTDLDISVLDDNALWDLHQTVKKCLDVRCTKSADVGRKCSQASVKISFKGSGGNILRYDCAKNKAVASRTVCKNGNMDNRQNDFTQSSSNHVDSGRSSVNMHNSIASSGKEYKRSTTGSQKSNLYSDVDGTSAVIDRDNAETCSHPPSPIVPSEKGASVVIDRDNADSSSHPSSPAVPSEKGQVYPPSEQQLSPTRALRAAYLRTRFADTIVKAQNRKLLNSVNKGDIEKMKREKEKLEKEQQKEQARIEAEIRAAESAARMKEEAELKAQREMEVAARMKAEADLQARREAARLALQKMEQTVHINEDNIMTFRELEALACARSPDGSVVQLQSCYGRRPLEQLGLFFKEDSLDEDDALRPQADNVSLLGLFLKEDEGMEAEDWLSPGDVSGVEEGEMATRLEEGELMVSANDGMEVEEGEMVTRLEEGELMASANDGMEVEEGEIL